MLKLFRKLKNNKDEFISDDNIYKIQRYFAMADYSYEDIVIFVNDKTLKSIKKDMYYNIKDIDLSKNEVIFSDDDFFSIEKIDEVEKLIWLTITFINLSIY